MHSKDMCGRGHAWSGACMAGGIHDRRCALAGEHAWQWACVVGSMSGRGPCMAGGHVW